MAVLTDEMIHARRDDCRLIWAWLAASTMLFAAPLARLLKSSTTSDLTSYIPLIPFVSLYLIYLKQDALPSTRGASITGALVFATTAIVTLVPVALSFGPIDDVGLTLTTASYLCTTAAGGFLLLGAEWMRQAQFAVGFMVFMIPLPEPVVEKIQTLLVLVSAEASFRLFTLVGTPILRDGLVLHLPGISLEVAQECSGIRSTLVLFITSVLASHLFLRTWWTRALLVALVLPLGIIRNGIRILTIGLLCVHVSPDMIDSFIHHRGGPIFFALSLVPFMLALLWLRRLEAPTARA